MGTPLEWALVALSAVLGLGIFVLAQAVKHDRDEEDDG